ncbi:MAG: indole-3-glycerol phosphate synthase TrpC [Chloroflexi bacterium]|nr:indole-3-glycerol phosphate synthase TrpC [Chloroflexota bacterium]
MTLTEIVNWKRIELSRMRRQRLYHQLESQAKAQSPAMDFVAALKQPGICIIAEVKHASPSKGLLVKDFDPVALARSYSANGAVAISVLTDERFFQGSLDDLVSIRQALATDAAATPSGARLPILRKDFLVDPYQIVESRAIGADAVLVIVAILNDQELRAMMDMVRRTGMHAVVEVHHERELERALAAGAEIIGINNRDLYTFDVDMRTTARLRPRVPAGKVVISESGVFTRSDVLRLSAVGAHAILVGEALVTAPDPGARLRELLGR